MSLSVAKSAKIDDLGFCFIASLRFIGSETPLKLLFFTRLVKGLTEFQFSSALAPNQP